jgi:hypothetical protein
MIAILGWLRSQPAPFPQMCKHLQHAMGWLKITLPLTAFGLEHEMQGWI